MCYLSPDPVPVRKIRPRLKRRLAAIRATTFLVATRDGRGMLDQRDD
jgi:hypothetical protein